ncbi:MULTISPECIES: hypothetical protein [Stenotrophomonas]|nr:hypothetical protein [Stenotrophomonas maltophilia]MBH1497422.1 hypothetical protein [Stenotrophomonas maltophilia]MBN4964967.1 hypothetical protein [Stenotrophomonas maltophilia]MBN5142483.1 hypothetical protein [Stenotrophomonas maltophilia]
MQHEPGRSREGGKGNIGRSGTMRVHVTECDVTVLLMPMEQRHAMHG